MMMLEGDLVATHAANALEAKSQSQNGSDGDNGNGGNGNGENGNGRNGNGNHGDGGNNENGNLNENGRGASLYHAQRTSCRLSQQRPERHESLLVHDAMVSRWRDRVASRPSLPSGSSSQTNTCTILVSHCTGGGGLRLWQATLIRPGEAIPFGRPYRTHPNGPRKLLTARKRVGPFPARRLAWRYVSHHLLDRHASPNFSSYSSSSGLSSDSSLYTSLGSPSDSLSDTSSVHSSGFDASGQIHSGRSTRVASSILVYPPVMTLHYSEAFRRWRPSHKRCKSPTTSIPSSTPVSRLIAPTHVDLLPPGKRFRDSNSLEDSREEHMEIGTADTEPIVDLGIGDGVGAHTEDGLGMGVKIAASDIKEAKASAGGMVKVEVDPRVRPVIKEDVHDHVIDDGAIELEAGQLIASGERAGLDDKIRRLGRENLRVRALLSIERDRVDSLRHHMALSQEEFCQICRDCDDARRRFRRLESFVERRLGFRPYTPSWVDLATHAANALEVESQSQNGSDDDNGNGGNGNGRNRNGGNGNGNHGDRGKNRNGNPNENGRGAMPVARVCTYQDFVKYQPLNFKGTEGVIDLMKLMMEVYYPRNEIQKMETELWNLIVKNNDLAAYTQRYQELTLLCTRMDAIRLANSLMDQKLKGYAIRSAENKRKLESNQRETRVENPSFKRQNVGGSNVARAYTAGGNEGRVYTGPRPLCNKCKLQHVRLCTVRCRSCGKIGYLTRDCKPAVPVAVNQRALVNHGNKLVNPEARGKSYAIGGGDANLGSNIVTATFLLNNHYAYVLFDSGVDQSFMSTTFSTLLDVTLDTLDVSYAVELADARNRTERPVH
ncbi:hypothetical protein Tco_0168756 [Tanacetum coccineum]